MGFLGMLKDSLRESLDRRSLIVVLVISTVFILICASIGFDHVELETALKEFEGKFTKVAGGRWSPDKIDARFEVSDIAKTDREDFEGGMSFRVRASPLAEFQKHVLYSRALKNLKQRDRPQSVPGISDDFTKVLEPPPTTDMLWFFEAKLRDHNLLRAKVEFEGIEGDRAAFKVWLRRGAAQSLTGGFRLSILFGAWTYDIRDSRVGDIVFLIQNTLAGLIAGWMGILVAIIATAGFIPNMIQKGTMDLLLARPLSRWRIYLYKYIGGLIYVVITAGYLIVGSWLAIALRSGIWAPGYLLAWPLLVFFFAALYSVSALVGVKTRSTIAAILLSAVTWLFLSSIGTVHLMLHSPLSDLDPDSKLVRMVDVAHDVLPRLKDVDQAILLCQLKANGISEEHLSHLNPQAEYPKVAWGALFGVTGAWMAAIIALGCWSFSRKEF